MRSTDVTDHECPDTSPEVSIGICDALVDEADRPDEPFEEAEVVPPIHVNTTEIVTETERFDVTFVTALCIDSVSVDKVDRPDGPSKADTFRLDWLVDPEVVDTKTLLATAVLAA